MSMGMRRMASNEHIARAATATTIVTGRRSAVSINHMMGSLSSIQERLQVALRGGDGEQRAPHAEPRQCVVDFGLRQQPLRIGYVHHIAESGTIARRSLLLGLPRGFELHRSIARDQPSGVERRTCSRCVGVQLGQDLLIARLLAALTMRFYLLSRAHGGEIEDRKSGGESERPVLNIRTGVAFAAGVAGSLQIELR